MRKRTVNRLMARALEARAMFELAQLRSEFADQVRHLPPPQVWPAPAPSLLKEAKPRRRREVD
jgi:hypothetical protein